MVVLFYVCYGIAMLHFIYYYFYFNNSNNVIIASLVKIKVIAMLSPVCENGKTVNLLVKILP